VFDFQSVSILSRFRSELWVVSCELWVRTGRNCSRERAVARRWTTVERAQQPSDSLRPQLLSLCRQFASHLFHSLSIRSCVVYFLHFSNIRNICGRRYLRPQNMTLSAGPSAFTFHSISCTRYVHLIATGFSLPHFIQLLCLHLKSSTTVWALRPSEICTFCSTRTFSMESAIQKWSHISIF